MPREAPVTSARLPSREAKLTGTTRLVPAPSAGRSSGEGVLELVERGEVVHRDRLDTAVDALDEPGEHVARTDLDEGLRALADELTRRLRELHGGRELIDQQVA